MNQGRIWCVVNPTVGLPLLLGSVAVTSLVVHAEILSHTSWYPSYWQGSAKAHTSDNGTGSPVASVTPQGSPAFAITVSPVPGTPGKTDTAYVVTVTPTGAQAAADHSASDGRLALAAPADK
ncbi:MAG TPA: light-harvesting protein [Acidisphaera sp.]|nr:light-harvesting protein [Acidisphaera sp.]